MDEESNNVINSDKDVEQPVAQGSARESKSNKKIYVILGIVLVVIVVGLIIFFVSLMRGAATDT